MENKVVTQDNLKEVIKLIDRTPRRSSIIVSLNSEEFDNGGLTMDKSLGETQYILAVGNLVTDLKVGDKVDLNISALTKMRRLSNNSDEVISEIEIKTIELDGYVFGQIDERVVESIYKK